MLKTSQLKSKGVNRSKTEIVAVNIIDSEKHPQEKVAAV